MIPGNDFLDSPVPAVGEGIQERVSLLDGENAHSPDGSHLLCGRLRPERGRREGCDNRANCQVTLHGHLKCVDVEIPGFPRLMGLI